MVAKLNPLTLVAKLRNRIRAVLFARFTTQVIHLYLHSMPVFEEFYHIISTVSDHFFSSVRRKAHRDHVISDVSHIQIESIHQKSFLLFGDQSSHARDWVQAGATFLGFALYGIVNGSFLVLEVDGVSPLVFTVVVFILKYFLLLPAIELLQHVLALELLKAVQSDENEFLGWKPVSLIVSPADSVVLVFRF